MYEGKYTAALQSPLLRCNLPLRVQCYNHRISVGRALGYRRHKRGAGSWIASYRSLTGRTREKFIGVADDLQSKNGSSVLNFDAALAAANAWFATPQVATNSVESLPLGCYSMLCACPVGDTYTVLTAMCDYIEYRKGFRSPHNHLPIIYMANAYIVPLIGHIGLDDLTISDVRSIALEVERTSAKRGSRNARTRIDPNTLSSEERRKRRVTANNTLSVLRAALKTAFLAGHFKNDAVWKYSSGFPTVHKCRVGYFTWDEARRLVDSARPDLRNLVLAALYTGARLSELLDIRANDVSRERMALYIRPQKTYRGRTIALPQEGYNFFTALRSKRANDERLFSRYDGGKFSTAYVAKHFRKLAATLGYPSESVFHSLRHTYATLLIQCGTPPIVVSRQLGHLNMATVIKHYTHVTDDFFDEELRSKFHPHFLQRNLLDQLA